MPLRLDQRRLWQRYDRRAAARASPMPRLPPSAEPLVRLPATHQAAAARLVDMAAVHSVAYRTREIAVSRDDADPELVRFLVAFLRELKRRGLPFYPHCLFRGEDEQERLFREGRSRAKWGQSAHNVGMAVDVVHFSRHWDLTEKEWAVLGLIGKETARKLNLKVTWGGDWSFYDPAHWELTDWRKRAAA